jgi:FkbM family methyltransferase
MKYSVVIPTYNHCDKFLKPCLEALFKYSNISDIELIISANGCTDNTYDYLFELKEKFKYLGLNEHLKIVWNREALGYARATNAGIKVSTCDKLVMLNNDAILLPQQKGDWLKMLNSAFETNPKCGISCSLKLYSPITKMHFGVFFCAMFKREVLDKVGYLDEQYEKGGNEDIDFCAAAQLLGYEVVQPIPLEWNEESRLYLGKFPLWHQGEGTVHDTNLVTDWEKTFRINELKLAKKYNIEWFEENKNKYGFQENVLEFLKKQHEEIYKEIIVDNCYEINSELVKDKTVIDIGANIGVFSLFASSLGAKKVIAIEPVNSTFSQLCSNIKESKFDNLFALKNAVSDSNDQEIEISLTNDSGHNSLYEHSELREKVKTITLSDIINQTEDDDIFLKIDCEGAEYDILLTVNENDMKKVKNIVMESHADLHPKYQGFEVLENKLHSLGFKLNKFKDMYSWQYNEKGEKINWKKLPRRTEIWNKL